MPLRLRPLFIIHRADLSVGDGALTEGAPAGRTYFQPEASAPDAVFLSLLLSVCFFFSSHADKTPIRACNSHIWRADIWRHSLCASALSQSRGANSWSLGRRWQGSVAAAAGPESLLPFLKERSSLQAVLQESAATGVA